MRTILLTCFTILATYVVAQVQDIPHSSFEGWTTVNGVEYPDGWEVWDSTAVQEGAINKASYATDGSSALYIGSYVDDGTVTGCTIEIRDTLLSRVGGIAFDFLVQNNNTQMLNGLFMQLYYYDENGSYMNDIKWSSPMFTNFDNYVVNEHEVPLPEEARSYLLQLSYVNAMGASNEYAQVDNLRFLEMPTGVMHAPAGELSVFPNPAKNQVSIEGLELEKMGSIRLTDLTGRSYHFEPQETLDLSSLAQGIYLLEALDTTGKRVETTKLLVQ